MMFDIDKKKLKKTIVRELIIFTGIYIVSIIIFADLQALGMDIKNNEIMNSWYYLYSLYIFIRVIVFVAFSVGSDVM